MKKLIIVFLVVVGLIGALAFLRARDDSVEVEPEALSEGQHEYYWGEECPHCENVDEFLKEWEQPEGVELVKLETWYDASNAKKLRTRAAECGMPNNQLGVPLLFTFEGKCIVGDEPIIQYLESL